MHPTLVFIFGGNAFAAANPNVLTKMAADQLIRHGDQAIQLATPAMNGPGDFEQLGQTIHAISNGQPIGLMGFSAGGSLALRLASFPGLNVKATLNFYGPPDLQDWLIFHFGDHYYRYVSTHVHLTRGFVELMSGVSTSDAYNVNAFGLRDHLITSALSTADFVQDFQSGRVYYYPGPHGVTLYACYPAFQDFLVNL
jgi:hypothetical protein